MNKNKIEILEGEDGYNRHVTGTYDLDGNNWYEWELETDDGMTSIRFIDLSEFEFNLEDEDDCEQIGLTEEEGEEIYDEILQFVNDNGYDFIGEEFE
tara:strand:- start:174 stop:464 length:291 start_codon:yes stop_codon:yes gene_type:complete